MMCSFITDNIDHVPHVIRPGNLELSSQKAVAIHKLETPTLLTESRFFIGIRNISRQLISNPAQSASPRKKD